jgi:hypothetical protein
MAGIRDTDLKDTRTTEEKIAELKKVRGFLPEGEARDALDQSIAELEKFIASSDKPFEKLGE